MRRDFADVSENRDTTGRRIHADFGDAHFLLERQRVELAIRARTEHAVAGARLAVDLPAQRDFVDLLVRVERRHDGDEGS